MLHFFFAVVRGAVGASLRSELFASAVVRLAIGLLGLEATQKSKRKQDDIEITGDHSAK